MPEPSPQTAPVAPLLCGKCGAENRPGARTCAECGSRLHVPCRHCGASNLRTLKHCAKCGKRLGRSSLSRFRERHLRRFALWEILVGCFLLALAGWLAWWLLRGIIFPVPEPEESEYEDTVHTGQMPKAGPPGEGR